MSTDILCGNYRIRLKKLDTKNEMKEVMRRHKKGFVELEEPIYHCEYFILSYQFYNEKEEFGIGIYSENLGFPPTIVSHYGDNNILIIYNNHLTLFDLCNGKINFDYISDSVIYFSKIYKDTIVVISELSVVQLQQNGDVLITHVLDDVLESFVFEEENIICKTMSGCIEYSLQY